MCGFKKNVSEKEGNVLFNDALNTFHLRLFGVRYMVKDHSDSQRKSAATTWVTLYNLQQEFFYMHHCTDRIAHTTVCYTSCGAMARTRNS